MTTVAECATGDEAMLLQSLLESFGLKAFLPDDLSVSYPPNLSGMRLQVADEDAEAARAILAENAP